MPKVLLFDFTMLTMRAVPSVLESDAEGPNRASVCDGMRTRCANAHKWGGGEAARGASSPAADSRVSAVGRPTKHTKVHAVSRCTASFYLRPYINISWESFMTAE